MEDGGRVSSHRSMAAARMRIDPYNLSLAGSGNSEAKVRDVQGSIWSEGHRRGERKARGHRSEGAIAINAHHFTGAGRRRAGETGDCVSLQNKQPAPCDKSNAQNGSQA